ncbi:hypothetical protein ANN_14091 [Periplaneta americana]|uniref:Uncharacterized protein n=1 Tax=Periplaneta americana TaxID=6978 RepID=A0ABQ8SWW2_PERAM|nr:hypothetical protein ANN_14091 [Periplaneta americana]
MLLLLLKYNLALSRYLASLCRTRELHVHGWATRALKVSTQPQSGRMNSVSVRGYSLSKITVIIVPCVILKFISWSRYHDHLHEPPEHITGSELLLQRNYKQLVTAAAGSV